MSTKRLTDTERATYLIGEAIMGHLEQAPDGPAKASQLGVVRDLLRARLTDDEVAHVITNTGWDIAGWFEEDETREPSRVIPFRKSANPGDDFSDDGIPF
jgi:hypothetical protein